MANIQDYLLWRKDVPFSVSPFNEVDGLVLSELIYADLNGCVPPDGERVSLSQVRGAFWQRHTREEILAQQSYTMMAPFLLDDMADSARFGDTRAAWFYDVTDAASNVQLAAATFFLPDGTAFVAFRGTDGTIVGWKEDFFLSFLPETEGQRRAAAYVNGHFAGLDVPLRLGGHSKGGNMAVYAAVSARPEVRDRIVAVYNNDGPGFLEPFTQTEAYRDMLPRVKSTVPQDSVIGALLFSGAEQRVVKSTASGIVQHDGFSWQVLGPRFVEAEGRSEISLLIESILSQWLGRVSEEDRRLFVNALFSLFEATGLETFSQMKQEIVHSLSSMKKMLEAMPQDQRDAVWGALTQLMKTGGDSVLQDARRSLNAWTETWAAREKKQQEPV